MMTAKITVERISAQMIRLTLVADVQVSASFDPLPPYESAAKEAGSAAADTGRATGGAFQGHELLTVEEAADVLHIGRDKAYHLIRTGQLRSIKIGKLRRISRKCIAEFVRQLEVAST
jgi:excisionase family DNA binding protein